MEDIELKVKVDVGQAEQNLDNLDKKVDQVADSVEDLNKTTEEGIPSVGSLDKAFESALNTIAKEGSKGGAALKKIFDSVKNAIPVVKNINNTALTGLKGIKAAIASTGIGLLVVALGEILTHWQDIAKWIGIGTERQEAYTKAVDKTVEAMDRLNFQHEKEIRLLKAAGASNVEIAEAKLKQAKEDREQLANLYYQNEQLVKGRKERKALTDEYVKQAQEADKAIKAAERELEIVKEEEKIRQQREADEKKNGKGISSTTARLQEIKEESKSLAEELKKNGKDVYTVMEAIAHNLEQAFPEESVVYFKNLLNPEAARAATEEVVAELKKAGVEINDALIQGLIKGDAQEYQNELQEMISARHVIFEAGHRTLSEDLRAELEIQDRAYQQELQILDKRMKYLKEYVGEGDLYKDLESQLVVIGDEREAFLREQTRRIAEAVLEERQEVLNQEEANSQSDMKFFNLKDFNKIYDERLKALQTYYKSMMETYDEGSTEYEKYKKLYEDITNQLNDIDKNRTQAMFQELNAQYKKWQDVLTNISSVFGSIADMYDEDSRAILENAEAKRRANEISEEEYKKEVERSRQQFERAKKLQIATTVVNTIAGAIGAFLQASAAYAPPYGQILGATSAAAVTAAGIAEIQKLKNKNFDSNNVDSGGGVSAPSVGVTPLSVTDDIQVSPSALAQSQSPADQRVWISQADLEESHRQVEIRENASTF